ncbi:patatin-like phospholipase family protein [Methylobacterium sp. J-077]|uniref:patatin-like phospholipase family protein n=1 Tax=Methylobacterium sp. J-077 TaxID=2836656 RepID=UPI001FBA2F95|nr:patatin-like phospholipase family protein [Methylobacterium sp. J-077]MCJ2125947.1 patatin-like phospholipase family protein [Methylobacterium sp. J-077]
MAEMKPRVALGLQGGGSYGAYGWGVIDRLLEEHIEIVAVSGASAGALNGAALVAGLATGGDDGGRDALERLWRATAERSPLRGFEGFGAAFDPFLDPFVARSLALFREASAYIAPFLPTLRDMHLFQAVVRASIDLETVARQERVPLYVSATDILTGAARLFTGPEVTLKALMASSCLPELFAPVEIDGRRYWDGGYAANPALEPLVFNGHGATDLIVLQLTPFVTDAIGLLPSEIAGRVSDISFNACLMRDLKALTELQRYARETQTQDARMRAVADINIHLLQAPCALAGGEISKLDTRWSTIGALRDLGRATAERWLAESGHAIGSDSSLQTLEAAIAS